jgi:hypothetical protein
MLAMKGSRNVSSCVPLWVILKDEEPPDTDHASISTNQLDIFDGADAFAASIVFHATSPW